MIRLAALSIIAPLIFGCTPHPGLIPATDRLAPWTAKLGEQQPEDAFVAVYRHGSQHLVFIGAVHENQVFSKTFRMIGQAFRHYQFGRVIVEGYPTSRGANPDRLLKDAAEPATADGFQPSGESVPAERGAIEQGAEIWGGEPDDPDVKAHALGRGISEADVMGFYVLRVVPQWIREKHIASPADPGLDTLVNKELERQRRRLSIGSAVLPSTKAWRDWYAKVQGRTLNDRFSTEEVGPRIDGPFPMNRISAIVAEARDAHLHQLTLKQLNEGASVLVVFGGSHLMMHRPALDRAIGKPCYVGEDLAQSARLCR